MLSSIKSPVDPNLSSTARTLLERLYELQGKRILTGQHEYLEAPYTYSETVKRLTGGYPAVKGVEFGGITGQTPNQLASQRQNVVDACKAWHYAGGIITASYHAAYPGTPLTWANVQRYTTQEEFNEVLTPGTRLNAALLADLDGVASYLAQLRDADIPVLWRPYHEMNGGWFWWGTKNHFASLWEIMFERFVAYHRLHNLIWVWSANANNAWSDDAAKYYVGPLRADAIGMDIYNGDYNQDYYNALRNLGQGKIMAITENGELPDLDYIRKYQPQYSWFLTWGKYLTDKNTESVIKKVYSHPFAFNRGEAFIPDALTPVTVPEDHSTGDGLLGKYYVGIQFNQLKVTKVVPVINFNWQKNTTVGSYAMSVVWTGFVKPEYTEEYTLYTNASDGVRLYIDGQRVIDHWYVQGTSEHSVTLPMEAGRYYSIRLEYYNNGDPEAVVQLLWSSPSVTKAVIPQTRLYSKLP